MTVGFQLGQYSEGTIAIAEPTLVPHVPASFKKLAKALQVPYVAVGCHQQGHDSYRLCRRSSARRAGFYPITD